MAAFVRRSAIGLVFAGLALTAGAAQAQDDERGLLEDRTMVGVDSLVGVLWQKITFPDQDSDNDSMLTIGSPGMASGLSVATPTRIGVHHFLGPLSVGTGLYYGDNDDFGRSLVFAPRIGYGADLSPSAAFWIRGGATYFSLKEDPVKLSGVMVGGELLAVLSPVENVAFLVGGTFEAGVSGTAEVDFFGQSAETDMRVSNYGVTTGFAFLF